MSSPLRVGQSVPRRNDRLPSHAWKGIESMPQDPIVLAISLLLAGSALIAALVVAVKALRLSRGVPDNITFERLQTPLAA